MDPLAALDKKDKVGGVLIIAPFLHLNLAGYDYLDDVEILLPWLETPIDLKKAAENTSKFVAIFSDDDPYVPISDSKLFQRELGADIIIERDKGHINEERRINKLQRILSETLKLI